ncbi:cupredoxin domain-containing protein [Paenibacillus alkalitolerans]|uniref:cytochrome C oxidase subunit II n=1 Tax=Paenibacillus alkalitolerans TaxID=2799335 RepID=UPI0018F39D1C|nr:cytochrome C oxidase subunit II [Paenibacillus alkalitolerans]
MYKWIVSVLFFGACAMGIGILFNQLPQAPTEEELAAEKNALKIVATDWAFDQEEYTVELGSTKTVKLVNEKGLHGIGIQELGIELQGATLEQEVTFDKPGTYEIRCIVLCGQGHADMVAKLVVKEGAEPTEEEAPAESAH